MTATGSELDGATAAEYRLQCDAAPATLDAMTELPRAVSIREVGPRDGFQNEPEVIPTERRSSWSTRSLAPACGVWR